MTAALVGRLVGRDTSAVVTGGGVVVTGVLVGVLSALSPQLAVAAALGVLFLVAAARNLALGFCLFVVVTFFDRTTAVQAGGVTVVKLCGAVLTLLWLLEIGARRRGTPLLFRSHPWLSMTILFLVSWTVASASWAPDPGLALTGGSGSAFRLAQGILLLFIVYTAFRERRHMWWLAWSFIGGAAFAALIGLIGVYGVSEGVNDARLSGGFDDPNELAAVIVPALALCGAGFAAAAGRAYRWVYPALGLLFLYSLAQTDSQAGIVALGVALVLAIALAGRLRPQALAVVGAFLLSSVLYYTFVTQPVALQTIASESNTGARETLWTVAGHVVLDHPVTGVGAGNFVVAEPAYAALGINLPRADLVVRPELVHNSYLQVLAELGVVGLLAFVGVVGGSLLLALRAAWLSAAAGDRELELLARGFVVGTSAMLAAYFFATNQYEKQLWLLLAAGPALLSVARRSRAVATPSSEHA